MAGSSGAAAKEEQMNDDWKGYQEAAAVYFRSLRLTAEVEATVKGARATHAIDVWVTFTRYGISGRWVVECKNWKSRVTKEKVMALQSVIQDIGADKGFLLSESGFQRGAHQAAEHTNITLTTLKDLQSVAEEDLLMTSLAQMSREVAQLQVRKEELTAPGEYEDGTPFSALPPGTGEDEWYRMSGDLSTLARGLNRGQAGRFPTVYGGPDARDEPFVARDLRALLKGANPIIRRIAAWVKRLEREST